MEDLRAIQEALPEVHEGLENEAQNVAPDLFNDDIFGPAAVRVLRENGVTVTEIRRMFGDPAAFKKCMCCPRHCRDRRTLLRHMREEEHFFGVSRLNELKKKFIGRLNENHSEIIAADAAFRNIHAHFNDLEDFERAEYSELLFLTLLQIAFRRT